MWQRTGTPLYIQHTYVGQRRTLVATERKREGERERERERERDGRTEEVCLVEGESGKRAARSCDLKTPQRGNACIPAHK